MVVVVVVVVVEVVVVVVVVEFIVVVVVVAVAVVVDGVAWAAGLRPQGFTSSSSWSSSGCPGLAGWCRLGCGLPPWGL